MGDEHAEKPQVPEGGGLVAEEVPSESGSGTEKRGREEGDEEDCGLKRQKVEGYWEEEKTDGVDGKREGGGDLEVGGCGDGRESEAANVGPKGFKSSVEMFEYFLKLLRSWSPDLDINKYEHMVLLDLLKKGHPDPAKKIGAGIEAFQVRNHPTFKSRCFFLVRADGTSDDFSFCKCVDMILPMPDHLKAQSTSDNGRVFYHKRGSHPRGGGRSGGRGYGKRGGSGK
ncbi:unnamed protein product [Musa acuminata subsp. malaccensis]|uniref:(wild Malaysian banana) hypothetical protein n=1 Tax=Musa acuminata subsp. malaccensis TaxID=214687 RepID=A0A804JCR7_MUSAM|nr:PREDICTED: uncharacterized protein LOC103986852 isoform X1 [Musa acuminata subsp. malaccensis]CAG1845316.1 unnamed protein product [Musa acuminata subsp. malaccensis]